MFGSGWPRLKMGLHPFFELRQALAKDVQIGTDVVGTRHCLAIFPGGDPNRSRRVKTTLILP